MTKNKKFTIASLLTIVFPWPLFILMAMFAFDGPASQDMQPLVWTFRILLSYPILVIVSILLSRFLLKRGQEKSALFFSAWPIILIATIFSLGIMLSLVSSFLIFNTNS